MERFTVTNTAGSLGDWLSLTPLLRAKPGSLVIAKDSPHTREFAQVYQGIADVEFVEGDIANTPETNEEVCFSQRVLNHFQITDRNAIPSIIVTDEEKEWAKNFLKDYPENLIAFNPTTASATYEQDESHICNYRRMPESLVLRIIDVIAASKKHTLIKFGVKKTQSHIYNNFEDFNGVLSVPDLTIRQVAACYSQIKQYIGTDTGDHHLMLSVGGTCKTFVPPSDWHYDHNRILYLPYAWKGEQIREVYSVFHKNKIPFPAK